MQNTTQHENLRTMVRGVYDIQKLRIQMGNRICAQFRARLGLEPSTPEDDDAAAKRVLTEIRKEYDKMTEGAIDRLPSAKRFEGGKVISTYTELVLIDQYVTLERNEDKHFRALKNALAEFPIYTSWLADVRGVGPAMAGVIISEIDIHKAKYASSLWKFCGLDVASDGRGRSRRKEHLVELAYEDKNGNETVRNSITFSPFIKTKLMGVLSGSFLRSGNQEYRKIYDDYKHRLENHPNWADKSKGHKHNAALRYMIKQFLVDLYREWRTVEGLPVHTPYAEGKLGLKHAS